MIAVPTMYGQKIIDVDDILFIKADGSYSVIHSTSDSIMVSKNLKSIDLALTHSNLIRVHRSYIVNVNKVTELHRDGGGYLLLDQDNLSIPLGDQRKRIVVEYLKSIFNFVK